MMRDERDIENSDGELIKDLQASGLNPIVIDENTDFSKLPVLDLASNTPKIFNNTKEFKNQVDSNFIETRSEDELAEGYFNENDYKIELDTSETKQPKHKGYGARNKQAGAAWEYKLIDYLKEVGYFDVVTTRGNSKFLDAQKVDVMNKDERNNGFLPFNLQAKTGATPSIYNGVLSSMPQNGVPNVIAFRFTRKAVKNFMPVGEFAIMHIKDWLYYIKLERQLNLIKAHLKDISPLEKAAIETLLHIEDEK